MPQPKPTADQLNLTNAELLGDSMAITASLSDNDTSIATTAFVKGQGYAPVVSPTFTGNPTAPTQPPGNNSTRLATTEFVTDAVASGPAAVNAGDVGTYALAYSNAAATFGNTIAGSQLTPASAAGNDGGAPVLSGTWRCMGFSNGAGTGDADATTLWLRIS